MNDKVQEVKDLLMSISELDDETALKALKDLRVLLDTHIEDLSDALTSSMYDEYEEEASSYNDKSWRE